MKNTIEITVFVFHLFGKLPMKKLHFIVLSLRIASGMQKTHTIVVWDCHGGFKLSFPLLLVAMVEIF